MAEMDLRAEQLRFAAHLRDPEHNPPPEGIEDRRMAIYRELFFGNISKLLAGTFPVLNKILGAERWQSLVRDFYSRHRSHTPLFLEVPREFLDYLEQERGEVAGDPPFLLELAHYEWAELALSIESEDVDLDGVDRDGDLLEGRPVLSPLAWPLAYRFPVHRISPKFQPEEPGEQPTWLVVYRALDDKVGFLEINAVTARLLELLGDDGERRSGREVLQSIAAELGHPDPGIVIAGGRELLQDLRRHDVILGTKR